MSIIENKIMKKIKGFTLLEAVFAIAVTILCAQILFGLIGTLRKVNRQKTGVNEISYSYVQINNFLKENDVPVSLVNRISAKSNTLFDLMLTDTVDLIIDIPTRNDNLKDGFLIRRFAVEAGIPIFTSLDTAQALITSLEKRHKGDTSLVDITKLK